MSHTGPQEDAQVTTNIRIPHFSLPFRFIQQGKGYPTAAVHEQDSEDEVRHCVEAILRYEPGDRPEKPEFGTPDQTFRSPTVDTATLMRDISNWEPRAGLLVTAAIDELDELIQRVRVGIESSRRGGTR